MNLMEQEKLVALIAEILETESVSTDADLADLGWDSLSNLSFIAEVDEQFDVAIDAAELSEAATVADLVALVLKARHVS